MSNPRILIVEDHTSVRTLLRVMFEAEGYRTIEADDGPAALEAAESVKPDLILLDLMMPELDGERVIARLSENPQLTGIPIIVVTAKQEAVDRMKDWLGDGNVFTKPFDQASLLARVEELIGPGSPLPSSPWKG